MADLPTYSISRQNDKISPLCLEHMENVLFTDDIQIEAEGLDPQAEKFHGHAKLWNLACEVEGLIRLDPPFVLLCARPETKEWCFGECFPQMPGMWPDSEAISAGAGNGDQPQDEQGLSTGFFLSQLGLQNGLLVYAYCPLTDQESRTDAITQGLESLILWREWSQGKHTASELVPSLLPGGLVMAGDLMPAGLQKSPFGSLLGSFLKFPENWLGSAFQAEVTIDYQGILPELKMRLPLPLNAHFGPVAMEDAHIAVTSPLYPWPESSRLVVECTIKILDTRLRIQADLPLEGDTITASASLLDKQQNLFKSPDPRLLPDLAADEQLKIELVFSKSQGRLKQISLATLLHDWEVLPDPFEFRELALSVLIILQEDNTQLIMASFLADVLLGNIGLTFEGFYPSGPLTCSLDADTPLNLREIGSSFDFGDFLPDLSISRLGFSYDFQGGGASGWLYVTSTAVQDGGSGNWPHQAFKDIHFRFNGPAPYTVEVGATFQVGGALLTLLGVRSGDDWRFEGSTAPGQELSMAQLIVGLENLFGTGKGNIPAAISSLIFYDLSLVYNTSKANQFIFKGNASLEVDDHTVEIRIDIDVTGREKKIEAQVIIGGEQFKVTFDDQETRADDNQAEIHETALIALYTHKDAGGPNIHSMVEQLSPGLSKIVPPIEIHKAIFGYYISGRKPNNRSAWLFGVELGAMNFSIRDPSLPIVSALIGSDLEFGIEAPQMLLTTQALKHEVLARLPSLSDEFRLPEVDLNAAALSANLTLGSEKYPLMLNIGEAEEPQGEPAEVEALASHTAISAPSSRLLAEEAGKSSALAGQESAITATPAGKISWIKVQKQVGPLYFEKVGVRYKDGSLGLLLGASLTAAGLTISLDGFSIDSPLDQFRPKFGLSGLGIRYKADPVEISGSFLREELDGKVEYSGQALIKAESFMLSAFGSFTTLEGKPSLFIFAFLSAQLGGPPCFFVTGLAAGFGYNRALKVPTIEQVQDFPLLTAMADENKTRKDKDLATQVRKQLHDGKWIPPQDGSYWLAAGISFTSFGLVKSSVLAVVEFGKEFQVVILGRSTIQLPKEGKAYAYAELMLEIIIKPAEGIVSAKALLSPNSYVIDPACHLTGGFAFVVWFGNNPHAGDFVLTLGGYHPHFPVPAWYPTVPRLGFNWAVSSHVTIRGEAYFALTPSAIMAGGGLEVLYHAGRLKAWFTAHMDVIIYWKPFYFDARIAVSIGASYKVPILGTLKVELGASVEIWGPPTGGKVHVSWFVISFTVSFGAKKLSSAARTVDWEGFKTMLPHKEGSQANLMAASPVPALASGTVTTDPELAVIQININNGLLKQEDKEDGTKRWVVRPDEFAFSIETTIPAATKDHLENPNSTTHITISDKMDVGIRPMGIHFIESQLTISICKGFQQEPIPLAPWDHAPIHRNLPEAMWGQPANGNLKPEAKLVENCLVGLRNIKHKPQAEPSGPPQFVLEDAFTYFSITPTKDGSLLDFLPLSPTITEPTNGFPTTNDVLTTIQATIMDAKVQQCRTSVFQALAELGVDAGTNDGLSALEANPAANYVASPMIGTLVQG